MDPFYIYFTLSSLFNAVVSTIFGVYVFWINKKHPVNITFALFCFSVAAWAYPCIFLTLAKTATSVFLLFQLLQVGACYISILYFHFVVNWLYLYPKKKISVYVGYVLATFFALSIFSPWFIQGVVPKFSMRYWAEPGILYHFYLLMFFGYFFYASYLLIRHYWNQTGFKKYQIKFVLAGIVLSFLGGSTNYFLWYNINIPPYGNILASSFILFTVYGVFMDRGK